MKSIEKLNKEAVELRANIGKIANFLSEELTSPKDTDEIDRTMLTIQLSYMSNYLETLEKRIEYYSLLESLKF